MNNQVAIRPNGGAVIAAAKMPDDPMNVYPKWYRYLLGSYPNSQTSSNQTMAMLHQFKEYDPDLLFQAAGEFVAKDERRTKSGQRVFSLPIPTEFRDTVEGILARREEQARAEEQARVFEQGSLRARRNELLELWYAGDVGDKALLGLAEQMERAGLEYAAASLRAKTRPSPERPDYAEFVVRYAEQLCGAAAKSGV